MRAFVLGLVVLAGPAGAQSFLHPSFETKDGCLEHLSFFISAGSPSAQYAEKALTAVPPAGREFADAMIAAQRKIDEGRKELADAALKLCNSYD